MNTKSHKEIKTGKLSKEVDWSLDKKLFDFGNNTWTIRNACEGVICLGATGSGKSSGPLRKMAMSFLKENFGGIVFCVKHDEKSIWQHYAEETGRRNDFMYLSEETFNFLSYERERPGEGAGEIENIVHLFMEIADVGKNKLNQTTNDEYWKDAVKQFLRNAVTLLFLAEEPLTLQNIKKVIDTAPRNNENPETEEIYCSSLIERIRCKGNKTNDDFILLSEYFNKELANLDNRTRSNIVSSFTVIVDSFLRGEMKRCFCAKKSSFKPEMVFDGKILIVDYNIKEWQKLGSYASAVIKYCFMQAVERRPVSDVDKIRPVFLFADECQNFAIPYDQLFQTTARSSKTVTVYATQNIGNLYASYGKDQVSSLLGNLGTKIFCQNGDDKTNNWASDSIGKVIVKRHSMSKGEGQSQGGSGSGHSNNESISQGWSEQKDYLVDPIVFTSLSKGSIQNKCEVEFVLWQSGRIFAHNQAYLKTSVKQECKLTCGAMLKNHCNPYFRKLVPSKILTVFGFKDILALFVFFISVLCAGYGYHMIINNEDTALIGGIIFGFTVTSAAVLLWVLVIGIFEGIEVCWALFENIINEKMNQKRKKKKEFDPELFMIYLVGTTFAIYKIYWRIVYDESFYDLILFIVLMAFVAKFLMFLGRKKGETAT